MPIFCAAQKYDAKRVVLPATFSLLSARRGGCTIAIGEKKPAWHYLLDAGISFVAYSLGNFVTYDLIFK